MKTGTKSKIIGICVLLLVGLGGCKMGKVVVNTDIMNNEVFRIREEICTLPQARVILTNYQNMYATMYGIDLWEREFQGNDLETYVKELFPIPYNKL